MKIFFGLILGLIICLIISFIDNIREERYAKAFCEDKHYFIYLNEDDELVALDYRSYSEPPYWVSGCRTGLWCRPIHTQTIVTDDKKIVEEFCKTE